MSAFWLNQTVQVLGDMQTQYWNGSYWPTTIQWVGALMNTFVASSDTTILSALSAGQDSAWEHASISPPHHDRVHQFYDHVRSYFGSEDTAQIFIAAYDDAQWVVLEWVEAAALVASYESFPNATFARSDVDRFAHRAHLYYNIVQDKFDTSLCGGGLTWNPELETYKNSITNELFISSSIAMYLGFPGDNNVDPYPSPEFVADTRKVLEPLQSLRAHDRLTLENAERAYAWFHAQNFRDSQGLVVDGFHLSRHQTKCDQRNEMIYTYNQGVLLTGLRGLWESTGNVTYLQDAYDLIHSVINATGWNIEDSKTHRREWSGLGRNGIVEDYCDAAGKCNQDQSIFKGAYFHHLEYFCRPLPVYRPLVPGVTVLASIELAVAHAKQCKSYIPWVEHNAYAALATRDKRGIIGQWWGEPGANNSLEWHEAGPAMLPAGAVDVFADDAHGAEFASFHSKRLQHPLSRIMEEEISRGQRQKRTVETQAQGLAVLKCATNLALWYHQS